MENLRNFAVEAERQYRRLAEYAESLGVRRVAGQLRDRAAKMKAMLEQNTEGGAEPARPSVLSEAADELYILGEEIHHRLSPKNAAFRRFLWNANDALLGVQQIVFEKFGMIQAKVFIECFILPNPHAPQIEVVVPRMNPGRGAQYQ